MTHAFDAIEAAAWGDLFSAARTETLSTHRLEPGLQLIGHGKDSLLLNRVIGVGPETTHSALEAMLASYRRAQVTRFFIHLYEGDLSPDLGFWLSGHGIQRYRRDWHKLARGVREPLPPASSELRVRTAAPADGAAVARIFAQGFDLEATLGELFAAPIERPRWHVHVASIGPRVVGASLLFVEDAVGYLAGAATDSEFRGRGAQLALLRERVRIALDLGCRELVSETGAPHADDPQHSYRNLQRAGFRPVAVRRNYAPTGTLWRHGGRE